MTAQAADLAKLPPEKLDANTHIKVDQIEDVMFVVRALPVSVRKQCEDLS